MGSGNGTLNAKVERNLTCLFVVAREDGQYTAFCPQLGVGARGDTQQEASVALEEAVGLYIQRMTERGLLHEIPSLFELDPKLFVSCLTEFASLDEEEPAEPVGAGVLNIEVVVEAEEGVHRSFRMQTRTSQSEIEGRIPVAA